MTKRTRAEWLSLFAKHQTSDMTAAAFCRQHQLCPKYFSLRKKQLQWIPSEAAQCAQPPPAFVPARVAVPRAHPIELTWQSAQLSLPGNVPPQWVAQLMKALAS